MYVVFCATTFIRCLMARAPLLCSPGSIILVATEQERAGPLPATCQMQNWLLRYVVHVLMRAQAPCIHSPTVCWHSWPLLAEHAQPSLRSSFLMAAAARGLKIHPNYRPLAGNKQPHTHSTLHTRLRSLLDCCGAL